MKFQSGAFLHFWFVSAGPFDAFVAFVALRASRVSRVCVACVFSFLANFSFFSLRKMHLQKKKIRCVAKTRGRPPGPP